MQFWSAHFLLFPTGVVVLYCVWPLRMSVTFHTFAEVKVVTFSEIILRSHLDGNDPEVSIPSLNLELSGMDEGGR